MARKQKPVVVSLSEEFYINVVNDRFSDFVNVLEEERPVVVDLSQVELIDYAALQLLYSFMRSCEEKEVDFSLQNISENVKQKIIICGLQKYFLQDTANGSI